MTELSETEKNQIARELDKIEENLEKVKNMKLDDGQRSLCDDLENILNTIKRK